VKDLAYWRNSLFATTVAYVLPLCLIALVPGLYMCYISGQVVMGLVDGFSAVSMAVIAFMPGLSIYARKVIFITCLYLLGWVILTYTGAYGPGLLYLMMACILSILIFSLKTTYLPALINTLICIVLTVELHYGLVQPAGMHAGSVIEWIAISSNLIFISFLSSALIPRLFTGLQETILKETRLKDELAVKQQSLQRSSDLMVRKNEELEQFAYVLSPDLQEPLRMVTGFMTRIEDRYSAVIDDKGRQYIHYAVDGGRRMHQMIRDLLDYSRIGREGVTPEITDLNEVIGEVKQLLLQQINEKKAVITTDVLPAISCDKTPMRQIFQNLISNALKYSTAAPRVHIAAGRTEGYWQFSVSDNGLGISKDDLHRIFFIFSRLHSREAYPGTGIGLSVTKKVIEQMGGTIWVESVEAVGSTFYFKIPENDSI
jgi:signal transduction histidine kinase